MSRPTPPPGIAVRRSRAGLGLFATDAFAKGDLVIEYTGERITEAEANRRGGKYLFELNDQYTIDGRGRENIARYMNHSCRPNCEAELTDDERQIFIYARRRIRAGEEFTYDYGRAHFQEYIAPKGCRCEKCSGA